MWTASGFDLPLHMITYFISTQRPLMHGVDHFEYLTELRHLVVIVAGAFLSSKYICLEEIINTRIIFD